jgi:FlaA1/EpsC-like NDP-sugar epimerase
VLKTKCNLINLAVGGLTVYAPDQIPRLINEMGVCVILLAIPSLSRMRRREIVTELEDQRVEIKTIPGMADIISGRAKISELRTVSAEDLLGRDPVAPAADLIAKDTTKRVVMVSGAGGSIGSELCRQILTQQPTTLVLYEVSEIALYSIADELLAATSRLQSPTQIIPILGSVQHVRRLETAIKTFNVQTIYHAAAYKHVPLVEENVVEGVRNNVFGTLAIVTAAKKLGVENFILISTDKAVRPTNVMGATKRIAELICQASAREDSSATFSMVRFGNVLGSSGSVIPRFHSQIESGGPITVTHENINRYFMTIPEAAQLVIQAGAMGKGGDVFVLDMGKPVKIMDLAISMVKLHGLTPYMVDHPDQVIPNAGDIPICVTGLRKGEKLYEELLIGNNPSPTIHPRIMTASEVSLSMEDLMTVLDRLFVACEDFDLPVIVSILHELPLDYAPVAGDISDLVWSAQQDHGQPQSKLTGGDVRA